MRQASCEQRSRWMYTRMVQEPRLTAEYHLYSGIGGNPVAADGGRDSKANPEP